MSNVDIRYFKSRSTGAVISVYAQQADIYERNADVWGMSTKSEHEAFHKSQAARRKGLVIDVNSVSVGTSDASERASPKRRGSVG
jgi:hypothetical protein